MWYKQLLVCTSYLEL